MDFKEYKDIEKEAHRICNEIVEKTMKEREDIIKKAWEEYQRSKRLDILKVAYEVAYDENGDVYACATKDIPPTTKCYCGIR